MDKDLRKLVQALEAQGFEVTGPKRARYKVTLNGAHVAVIANRSSDWRAWRNNLARLRRAGFRP